MRQHHTSRNCCRSSRISPSKSSEKNIRSSARKIATLIARACALPAFPSADSSMGPWPYMKDSANLLVDGLPNPDDSAKQEGKLEEFEELAIKQPPPWQLAEAMRAQTLSPKRLAERMKTSRSQISRLLDPKDGNVTIITLQRAAKIVGRTLRVELVKV